MASNTFINECKNRANANRLGKIIPDGVDMPITNSNSLQSFSIASGCYVNGDIIGSVYPKCLNANFVADQNNLTDKTIQAQIGVKYADLTTEYINLGKYKVERPNNEITANMSQITAYDDLYTSLDNKYVCNIDYSSGDKSLVDLYIDVCNQLGLAPKTTTFTNSTIPISNNPFTNGEKNRIVLQTIAKISCSFVDIDNDANKIDLCWLSQNEEPDYIFYKNDYVSVDGGQIVFGPINCLIIKNSVIDDENITIKDEESIAIYGEHSIVISEDYILHTPELREQAINSIWNKVKGMKYVDCKLTTYYGKPFLNIGDKIRIYINETDYFDTYVLKHTFTYDGTFSSVIESPAMTEQEIKTKQDVSLAEKLWQTKVDIDKQNARILAEVKETQDNSVGKDDIIASLNLAIENGQGIVKFTSNQFLVESDKLKIDETGKIVAGDSEFNNVVLKDGNLLLKDDGSSDGASIKIETLTHYLAEITLNDDLSNQLIFSNFEGLTYEYIINNFSNFPIELISSENYKIVLKVVEARDGNLAGFWLTDSDGVILGALQAVYEDNSLETDGNYELPADFGNVTYINPLSITQRIQKDNAITRETSYSGYGMQSDIISDFNYDNSDIEYVAQKMIEGEFTPEDIIKYDTNKDGIINVVDLSNIRRYVLSNITPTNPGKFIIDTHAIRKNIQFKDGDGNEKLTLGLDGIYIDGKTLDDLYGANNILWQATNVEGGYYMTAEHTAALSEKISDQSHGIILVWWAFNPETRKLVGGPVAQQVIPKYLISDNAMTFHQDMHYANFTYSGTKVVNISNNSIKGNDTNTATGTGGSGIKYSNNRFVLSYVIGF